MPQEDKKAALETPVTEEIMCRVNGRVCWIPYNRNPSDGLAKLKGAHLEPLMDLLKTSFYTLIVEEVALKTERH